jgi:hypothetical protein
MALFERIFLINTDPIDTEGGASKSRPYSIDTEERQWQVAPLQVLAPKEKALHRASIKPCPTFGQGSRLSWPSERASIQFIDAAIEPIKEPSYRGG